MHATLERLHAAADVVTTYSPQRAQGAILTGMHALSGCLRAAEADEGSESSEAARRSPAFAAEGEGGGWDEEDDDVGWKWEEDD